MQGWIGVVAVQGLVGREWWGPEGGWVGVVGSRGGWVGGLGWIGRGGG